MRKQIGCPTCNTCRSYSSFPRPLLGLIPDTAPTYSSGTPAVQTSTEPSYWDSIAALGMSTIDNIAEYYQEALSLMNQGMEVAWAKVVEAKEAMQTALQTQAEIDAKIEMMPAGSDRDRVIQAREDSKGFFENYVLPAWVKFSDLVGLTHDPSSSSQNMNLGWVPVVAISVAVAAVALSAVAYRYISMLEDIRQDPAFSSTEKAGLLSSFSAGGVFSSVEGAAKQLKWPLILIGSAAVLYFVSKNLPKSSRA